jgi:O-antigen/teichoic acid export membrane protein
MGVVQKDSFKTLIVQYLGLFLGYINKGLLFIWLLTAEQIGLVNLLVSVGLLFGNLSGLGSSYAIWKFFPFLKNKENNHNGFFLLISVVCLVGALIFSILSLVFYQEITSYFSERSKLFVDYYFWIIPLGIANIMFMIIESFLRSMYHNVISVVAYEIVLRGAITVSLVLIGIGWINFDTFLVLNCLVYFVPVLIVGMYMRRIGELHLSFRRLKVPRRIRKIILTFSLFSYVNSIGALVVVTLDAMMIASMIGLKATGVYTTIIYLTSALQIPYKSLNRISAPLVADYWKERKMEEMNTLYRKFSSISLFMSMGMFLGVWINRYELMQLLPKEFGEGMYVFLFLMIGRLFDMYMGLNGMIFTTSKKYRYDILFTVSLILIVYLLNLKLIPVFGITGAAIATAIGLVVYNVGRVIFIYVVYRLHPFEWKQIYLLLLSAVLLAGFQVVPWPESVWFSFVVKSIIFSALYLGCTYYFRLEHEVVALVDRFVSRLRRKRAE